MEQDHQVPNPISIGWKIEREGAKQLVVHYLDCQPAPEAVLDLLPSVHSHSVSVWQIDPSALVCAKCQNVKTSYPSEILRMKMSTKVNQIPRTIIRIIACVSDFEGIISISLFCGIITKMARKKSISGQDIG